MLRFIMSSAIIMMGLCLIHGIIGDSAQDREGCNGAEHGILCCINGFTPGDNEGEEIFIQASDYMATCVDSCKSRHPRSTGVTESVKQKYGSGNGKNKNKCWCELGEPRLNTANLDYQTCVFGPYTIVENGVGCTSIGLGPTLSSECVDAAASLGFTGQFHVENVEHTPPGCYVGHPMDGWANVVFNSHPTGYLTQISQGRSLYKSICYPGENRDQPRVMASGNQVHLPLKQCTGDQVSCQSINECISKDLLCNGVADCTDGSDEVYCDFRQDPNPDDNQADESNLQGIFNTLHHG